jgi:dephospho-CoA kinase
MEIGKGITVIVGSCATGKTFFANYLEQLNQSCAVYHTDDYLKFGEPALSMFMRQLERDRTDKIIVEGNMSGKWLRVSQQLKRRYNISTIYECHAPKEVRAARILARGKDVNATFHLDSLLYKTLSEYKRAAQILPRWEMINTLTL